MLAKFLIITILYTAIGLFEIPHLLAKKYHRELFIFLALLLPAFVLSLLYATGVNLPHIIPAIATLLQPLTNWFK